MASKLRVGVIGTGFGSLVQIPAFRAHPRVDVVGVAGGRPGKARSVADRFGLPYAFDDDETLIRADLDLVCIATPPYLHHPETLKALAAERSVLCEKPMALSATEAEDMLRAAEGRRGTHLIDHELRFNPNRRKIKDLIDKGFIGRPRHALVTSVGLVRTMPWTWWSDAARGGGILGAVGSHLIDLLRYWLGEIQAVAGLTRTFTPSRPLPDSDEPRTVTSDDFAAFTLTFASGAIGAVMVSAAAAHARGPRLEVWGDEGTLTLDEGERLWGAARGRDFEELTEPETLSPPPGMDYLSLWGLSFVRLVDHTVRVLLDGEAVQPLAMFADGVQVQRVMDGVRAGVRDGWVHISPPHH
jgi:predicted dehydrogenase